MKFEDLHVGLPVRIAKGHGSGYGGKQGVVIGVGESVTLDKKQVIIGASVEIGGVFLVLIEAEFLDLVSEGKLPPGWSEFEV
ncbi:hypothetical protein [Paenibacillus graminis]|uniref:KOW domain-containing protein n=1 Tax=Paenibacillus graminis TaxID=189425 RepID=A0A089NMR3_9BACL|nr:hypothetical protein [Paenibacillus graminis]AIQ70339.1 hypothetical protein PGRAT_23885 [Paenibacillus graminis]